MTGIEAIKLLPLNLEALERVRAHFVELFSELVEDLRHAVELIVRQLDQLDALGLEGEPFERLTDVVEPGVSEL